MSEKPEQTVDNGGGAATTPAPKTKPPAKKPKQLPPFKLLLHNDDKNTFEHVIRTIVRLTPIHENEATIKALEAHEAGLSLLLVTHKERGELYMDQFRSLSIITSLEADA